MKYVLKTLNTIIKTNKSIMKKQNNLEFHLNRSVSLALDVMFNTMHLIAFLYKFLNPLTTSNNLKCKVAKMLSVIYLQKCNIELDKCPSQIMLSQKSENIDLGCTQKQLFHRTI